MSGQRARCATRNQRGHRKIIYHLNVSGAAPLALIKGGRGAKGRGRGTRDIAKGLVAKTRQRQRWSRRRLARAIPSVRHKTPRNGTLACEALSKDTAHNIARCRENSGGVMWLRMQSFPLARAQRRAGNRQAVARAVKTTAAGTRQRGSSASVATGAGSGGGSVASTTTRQRCRRRTKCACWAQRAAAQAAAIRK